jgi:2'-5' RNA ligase
MRYGIYLGFDKKTETALDDLRRRLFNDVSHMPPPKKMRPHLTLLVFDDDEPDGVMGRFKAVMGGSKGFGIKLNCVGSFLGKRSVLYIEPQMSKELKAVHARVFEIFSGSESVPSYRDPKEWKPHITLAKGLTERTFLEAKTLAENLWKPATGKIHLIGLIDVQKPLEILASRTF